LHAIERPNRDAHRFRQAFAHFQNFLHRRGIVVCFGFLRAADVIVRPSSRCAIRGNDVSSSICSTAGNQAEIPRAGAVGRYGKRGRCAGSFAEYTRDEYPRKIDSHIEALRSAVRGAGMEYFLMNTARR